MMEISATSSSTAVSRTPGTPATPVVTPTGLEGLTASDKSLIRATTGYTITDGTRLAPAFAFDIAADRKAGILTGDVNSTYLDGLMDRENTSFASQLAATKDDATAAADSAASVHDSYERWYATATAYLDAQAAQTPRDGAVLDVQA